MQIAYTVLVVLDVDEESDPGREVRELTAQLRTAAYDLIQEGPPEPGESRCLHRSDAAIVYLSAADLSPALPPVIPQPDPWTTQDPDQPPF